MNQNKLPTQIAEERIRKAYQSRDKFLDLVGLGLRTVPESIHRLTELHALQLSLNQLTELPESIGQLALLQDLDISGNQLTALPDSLKQLTELRTLYAWSNNLAVLPKWLGHMKTLEDLVFSNNKLTRLPQSLSRLHHLQRLDVSKNMLTTLPTWLSQLKDLEVLDVSGNLLDALPDTLIELSSLRELFLHDNPALRLPRELLRIPEKDDIHDSNDSVKPATLLSYYFHMRGGERPLNEAKLILVGRGEVGKTSIVKRLVRDTFNVQEKKTQGLNITDWNLTIGEDSIRLNIWDFGGQEIMHATHQFFLTERSLYLLVLNGREGGEDYDIEYWLKLITSFGGESPVIVVQNKINEHPFELNYRGLRSKYPQIQCFVKTDCLTSDGITELRELIRESVDEMPAVRASFPAAWFAVRDELERMTENYLSYEEYRAIAHRNGETDMQEQDRLAAVLHDLGIALNYKDDPRLRDATVLNPRWVTEGIYTILNSAPLSEQHGIMVVPQLSTWLSTTAYPPEKHIFLLELMRKFRLCFAFPEDEEQRYLVPELLEKEEPDLRDEFEPADCLNFEYHYNILPEGLLPQFIVRNYVLIDGLLRWRTGVVLRWEGCRVLVKADAADRRIEVRVCGAGIDSRRRLLAIVRSDFERIHSSFTELDVVAQVPVPGHPEATIGYDELTFFEQNKVAEFPMKIGSNLVVLKVADLLSGVDISDLCRRRRGSVVADRGIQVMCCYSHKDEGLRDELETHLKLLQRQECIAPWHDRRLLPGDEWKGIIDERVTTSEVILLLVSADFIASNYCYEIEMQRAMERHESKEAVIIPIILRHCDWQSAPFAKLQVLPRDGRPVKAWPDRDRAWNEVAQSIRGVVMKSRAV